MRQRVRSNGMGQLLERVDIIGSARSERKGRMVGGRHMGINLLGYQTTLRERIEFSGIGVHSGRPVTLSLNPADAGTGILFSVTCPRTGKVQDIPATLASVSSTDLCTVLGNPAGVFIATIEHLMAALRAFSIDNVVIEVDSNEVPVMDGSAADFVDALGTVGLTQLPRGRRCIRVLKPVRVEMGTSWGEFVPHAGCRYEVEIDFDCPAIGRQRCDIELTADSFRSELSRARTFGFMKDVERLWAAGFALGSSLENSVVIGEDNRVLNTEGLRYADEFVRHKALDAVGDLALSGAPIIGCFRSYRGGHKLNALTLDALMADSSAYEMIEIPVSKIRTRHDEILAVVGQA